MPTLLKSERLMAAIDNSNSPEYNRRKVANNEAVTGYIEQESLIKSWWHGYMPPKNLRFGSLPTIPNNKGTAPKYMPEEWYNDR